MSETQPTAEDSRYPDTIEVGTFREPTLATDTDDDRAGATATLPLRGEHSVLTGRALLTGKSGAGKSNTANVVIEELLRAGRPLAIIDTEGEYFGLKEEFEMLHVGGDSEADVQVGPEHGKKLAELALERNVPIIVDVSGYIDEDTTEDLLFNFLRALFAKAKTQKRPFPVFVEEAHSYLPERGGTSELEELFITLGKRGRKHGLGVVAITQRPADIRKSFITQCNWVCWHRLTWKNDTKVVSDVLGSEYAASIEALRDGEAFLAADWEADYRRVSFRRQETYDGGATPTLADEDSSEVPDLKTVGEEIAGELEAVSERQESLEDENAALREELEAKEETIADLREELETRDYVSEELRERFDATAETFAEVVEAKLATAASAPGDAASDRPAGVAVPEEIRAEVLEVVEGDLGARVADLEAALEETETQLAESQRRVEDLQASLEAREARIEELEAENDALTARVEDYQQLEATVQDAREAYETLGGALGVESDSPVSVDSEDGEGVEEVAAAPRVEELEAVLYGEVPPEAAGLDPSEVVVGGDQSPGVEPGAYVQTVEAREDALTTLVEEAVDEHTLAEEHYWGVLRELAEVADGSHPFLEQSGSPRPTHEDLVECVDVGDSAVRKVLNALVESVALVESDESGPQEPNRYTLNTETFGELEKRAAYYERRDRDVRGGEA